VTAGSKSSQNTPLAAKHDLASMPVPANRVN
jgi:hypothetical protein